MVTSFQCHRFVNFLVVKARTMTRRRHGLPTFPALNTLDKAVPINFDNRQKIVVVILAALAQFTVNIMAT